MKEDEKHKDGAIVFEKFIGEVNRERAAFSKYRTNPKDLLSNFIVRPMIENERQRKQQGLFVIFGLQSHIYNNQENFTIKRYKISVENKTLILKQLDKLEINESTLFGDIESRAHYIRSKDIK